LKRESNNVPRFEADIPVITLVMRLERDMASAFA